MVVIVQKTIVNIYLLDIIFEYGGVAKTNIKAWKCSKPYSWFIHILSSKFYLVDILKSPTKSSKIPNLLPPNPLSYPISSKPTKIKHFSHFITQKLNFHLTKNLPTIPKSSLFISTFTDNVFHLKIVQIISHHIPYTGATIKLHTKLSRQ